MKFKNMVLFLKNDCIYFIDATSSNFANITATNLTSNAKKSNGSMPVFNATFMKNKTSDAVKSQAQQQNATVVELKSIKNNTSPIVQQNTTTHALVNTTNNNSTLNATKINPNPAVGGISGSTKVAFIKSVQNDESKYTC